MQQATIEVIDALRKYDPLMTENDLTELLHLIRAAWRGCDADAPRTVLESIREAVRTTRVYRDLSPDPFETLYEDLTHDKWEELRCDLAISGGYFDVFMLVQAYTTVERQRYEEKWHADEAARVAAEPDWYWQEPEGIWLRFVDGIWVRQVDHGPDGTITALNRDRSGWEPRNSY